MAKSASPRQFSPDGRSRAEGFSDGDNPARFGGNLEFSLPKQEKTRRVVHHPALPWQDLPGFFAKLEKEIGTAAEALQLVLM